MAIRVLIADDHSVVRQGLQMFLALDSELELVGEAANGSQAIDLARRLRPDVVLMDLLMPEVDGFAATEAIKRELSDTEVIALTSVLEDKAIFDAIRVEGEVGIGKPQPAAFVGGLAALGASGEPAAMIGDDLQADVAGAQRAGLTAVWVDHRGRGPGPVVRPDRVVRSLAELLEPD